MPKLSRASTRTHSAPVAPALHVEAHPHAPAKAREPEPYEIVNLEEVKLKDWKTRATDLYWAIKDVHRQANTEERAWALERANEAGFALIKARTICQEQHKNNKRSKRNGDDGGWTKWVKKNLPFSHATACTYIKISEKFQELLRWQPDPGKGRSIRGAIKWLKQQELGADSVSSPRKTTRKQVVASAASPARETIADDNVPLPINPTAAVTLSDSAVLSVGDYTSVSISFTLNAPHGFSVSQTDPASADSADSDNVTLPTTMAAPGTVPIDTEELIAEARSLGLALDAAKIDVLLVFANRLMERVGHRDKLEFEKECCSL